VPRLASPALLGRTYHGVTVIRGQRSGGASARARRPARTGARSTFVSQSGASGARWRASADARAALAAYASIALAVAALDLAGLIADARSRARRCASRRTRLFSRTPLPLRLLARWRSDWNKTSA